MSHHRVGLIGCGHIAGAHLTGFQKIDTCDVIGVFDLDRELAEQRAKEYAVPRVFESLEELIAECDVADVCTPPHSHHPIAMQVVQAGLHLLIEKPTVIEVAHWDELHAAIETAGVKLTVVHNLKFTNAIVQAQEWVAEGRIGEVIRIDRQFLTSHKHDRMLVGNSHWSHKLPGGRWFETLPHELYITHAFVGPADLKNVVALSTPSAPAGAPADEVTITLATDQCVVNVHYSGNCSLNRRRVTFYGSEGVIEVDILSDAVTYTGVEDSKGKRAVGLQFIEAGSQMLRAVPDRAGYLYRRSQGESPHTRVIREFGEYLNGGEPPTPIEEVDYVIRGCERIGRAIDASLAKSGATQQVG